MVTGSEYVRKLYYSFEKNRLEVDVEQNEETCHL